MSHYFESIKLVDGELQLLDLHQDRVNFVLESLNNKSLKIELKKSIVITDDYKRGLFKVKVEYGNAILAINFSLYQLKTPRIVKIIEDIKLKYIYKSVKRDGLENFLDNNRDKYDDVIFTQNGLLTDSSYSNLIFYDGEKWFTPKEFLLSGVKRKYLLTKGVIEEMEISIENLKGFKKIGFINAMRDFEEIYDFEINEDELILSPTL